MSADDVPLGDAGDSIPPDGELPPIRWKRNLVLFVVTLFSVFLAGMMQVHPETLLAADVAPEIPRASGLGLVRAYLDGWVFAVPLLAILVCHEFGHWIAARLHRVPASLPYFIPLPVLSPFGTMGAVISMRGRIRSRNALLDIGAAGPIAGMVVAFPVMLIGLALSSVEPRSPSGFIQEGQSLLYALAKWLVHGSIPDTHDVFLHPTAFAGWAGFLITMINLLPWGQLDGGHIAYALFGQAQDRYARWVRWTLLPLFAWNLSRFVGPFASGPKLPLDQAFGNSLFWLVWFLVTGLIGLLSGGARHPPCDPGVLTKGRKAVAVGCLVLFVLLFMPTPWATY